MTAQHASPDRHDHQRCITRALKRAESQCAQSGVRMTALRQQVLEYLWRGHDAVKAYDILDHLASRNRPAKPPTVYRTLQFLQELGLVHRLESLNAYVGCMNPQDVHPGQFFICTRCGWVNEFHTEAVTRAVQAHAQETGFLVAQQTLEVRGTCQACQACQDQIPRS